MDEIPHGSLKKFLNGCWNIYTFRFISKDKKLFRMELKEHA